jgi:hypothetical protein
MNVLARCTLATLTTVAAGCTSVKATSAELHAHRELRGTLVTAETTFTGQRGRYAAYRVRLRSSTGLQASGRLLRPMPAHRRYPAVLLNDGRELDSRALDFLPADFGDLVVISLDYPAEIPFTLRLRHVITNAGSLRDAAGRIPALFSLAAAYLSTREDVDTARVALAATSFAVPFAVIAAASDERFQNVGLVYGAGDMAGVLASNLDVRPRFLRRPFAWLAMRPFRDLAPERYAAFISPRLLVMVNGIDDPQMPQSAVQALYDAARQPKAIVWLPTGHLMPTDSALIRTLVDTALSRLPVLQAPREATASKRF